MAAIDPDVEPYRGWRGLIVGDYDRAVLRVAIATQNERRQLLFASVELLPAEIPSPPEAFEKQHFKQVQLSACRVVVPLDDGLDWYEAAWAGQMQLPRSTIAVEAGTFAAEPAVKRFALAATPPFSPTWHMTPRIHRLAPVNEAEGLIASLATGMTTVPALKRARVWLERQLHFDVLAHDDWLGAVALVAPNPLMRDIRIQIASRDAAAETVKVGGQLRAAKSARSLKIVFQERRVEALGVYSIKPLGPHGYVQERFEGEVADFGLTLTCDQRGILHENVPSWFMRGFQTYVQDQPLSKKVTVPARKAAGVARGVASVTDVQPLHVGAYIEGLSLSRSAPTAKQHLAAIRHLFDWLVMGQVVPLNPAASVRGPSHSVRRGKTPVLDPTEARQLLDAINIATPIGLRDRALIGLMVFSFARIGAALGMKVEDVYVQNRRLWVRLHEKGGKIHEMPCHHYLETYLDAYLDGCDLRGDPKGPLFRTIDRGRAVLSTRPLPQANAYAMIGRRATAAGIATKIGNHTFRATGITAYLKNGGTLENAAAMANHASTRTTQLYDRRSDQISLDEIERVRI